MLYLDTPLLYCREADSLTHTLRRSVKLERQIEDRQYD
jgi:hypothetical protein